MSLWPGNRLLAVVLWWTAGAALVVVAPVLTIAAAGTLALLLVIAAWDAWSLVRLRAVTVARCLPERVFAGRSATIVLEVSNPNPAPVSVSLIDEPAPDVRPNDVRFDSVVIAAQSNVRFEYAVTPQRRGDRPFGPVLVLTASPLQLWRRRASVEAAQVLRVYPDTSQLLRPEALDPKRMFAALGARPAPQRGDGMEFESLRDYVAGDDPRRLDWAASARRGRPVTRLYQHERNHTVIIAVDASRLMAGRVDGRSKLDYSVEASLALAYAGLVSADRVGLAVFAETVAAHLAPRGHRHEFGQFVELLRSLEARPVEPDYRALVRQLMVLQRQQALVVVLTDFVEAAAAALIDPLLVLARRHRVLLVGIRDRLYRELDGGAGADELDLYRRLVLHDLAHEREVALATLRAGGLQTLDLLPESLTAGVLNRYLAIRYGPER